MRSKKQIHFLAINNYPKAIGGLEIFNYYFVQNISTYFPVSTSGYDPIKGIEFHRILKLRPQTLFIGLQFFLKLLKLRKKIKLVVLSYSEANSFVWLSIALACKIAGLPYAVIHHWGVSPNWTPKLPYLYLFNNSAFSIGISKMICEDYSKLLEKKLIYIPPLIPFSFSDKSKMDIRAEYNIPDNAKIICYVGSLKSLKRPQLMLDAFIKHSDYFISNNFYLIFAGDGEYKHKMHQKIEANNLDNRIRLLGNVLRENIGDIYKMSDYYVILSEYEGTPLSMLEAMFNSLPIVAANAPGINSIIETNRNGILFDPEKTDDLFNKIKNLNENDDLRMKIAQSAFSDYQIKYNYQLMLDKYIDLLK